MHKGIISIQVIIYVGLDYVTKYFFQFQKKKIFFYVRYVHEQLVKTILDYCLCPVVVSFRQDKMKSNICSCDKTKVTNEWLHGIRFFCFFLKKKRNQFSGKLYNGYRFF